MVMQKGLLPIVLGFLIVSCGSTPTPTPSPSASPSPAQISSPAAHGIPSARFESALAYDPVSQRLVLFGGFSDLSSQSQGALGDMWSWDGLLWSQLHPQHMPPAMGGAQLVLDPNSGNLILVGGSGAVDANGFPVQLGIWKWNGTDWSRLSDSPIQQACSNAAADPVHKLVVMDDSGFTGAGPLTPPPTMDGGAWAWNGSNWTSVSSHLTGSDTVMGSQCAGMGYDPIGKQVIHFGGGQQYALDDTLSFDGSQWTTLIDASKQNVSTYPASGNAVAATDSSRNQLVMLADATWVFDGSAWQKAAGAPGPTAFFRPSLAYDPTVSGVVLFGVLGTGAGLSASSSMYLWDGHSWTQIPV